jgi:hypothetical protein
MTRISALSITAGFALAAAVSMIAAIPAVEAACSSRPVGWIMTLAPHRDSPRTTLTLGLRSRGNEARYWDIVVREGSPTGRDIGRNRTGWGPGFRTDFPDLNSGKIYCFQARPRTEPGTEGCLGAPTEWSCKATAQAPHAESAGRCREYALRAREARTEALGRYGCDRKVISGRGWEASYTEHYTWCLGASADAAAAETAKRTQIMHQCRVDAARPKGGDAKIQVHRAGNFFIVNGSGFAPNAPVVIRLSGSGAATPSITTHHNQRIVANATGRITLRLAYPFVCKPGSGSVFLAAEDQDNRRSPLVRQFCSA